MKIDLTSGPGVLSSKIEGLISTLLILLCLPVLAYADDSPNAGFHPLFTPAMARSIPLEERVVIDTRSLWKFYLGHVPGAIRLSDWREWSETVNGVPGMINQDRSWIARQLSALGLDRNKTIILYGEGADPWRTDGRFFWMFHFYGFKRVGILDGGYERWIAQGGESESGAGTEPSPSKLTTEDIVFDPEVAADQNWIFSRLGSPGLAVIDNRTTKEYKGDTPYGSPRGGHIPHALHIDWRDFFDAQGVLKEKPALESLLATYGIRRDQDVVVYCTGGVRSGMAYFVLSYLGFKVRNYDGSWWDWSRNPALPVE